MMPSTMRVPIFQGEGRMVFENRDVPRPEASDDVLVAIEACGICGTDLNILAVPPAHQARPGIILGHEGVGVVAEVGPAVHQLKPGDRVVIAPRLTCGKCRYCRRGIVNQCENYLSVGTSIDGAFAPYLRVPERALHKISAAVAQQDAVLFEPLSCVVGATARVPVRPGDRVAIVGAGPIGALFAMLYRALGAGQIIMADISPARLEQAKRFGADAVLNAAEVNLKDAVLELTDIGADIVVDAVGNQLGTAINLARRAGSVILFGLRPHDTPAVKQYTITRYDLTIVGTFVGLNPFVQTIQLLESGIIHPGALITHRLPLEMVREGVELMRSGQGMKVVIEI
jgi:threonine dehydrogenase-like Zn-dependent dehydrogenase